MSKNFVVLGNIITKPECGVIENGGLEIDGDTIVSVYTEEELEGRDFGAEEVVDCRGKYLLPGLIDAHCHLNLPGDDRDMSEFVQSSTREDLVLTAAENARKSLEGGVTTLRDLGGYKDLPFKLRDASTSGLIRTPRLVLAGRALTTTGGHGYDFGEEVDTPSEMIKAVRTLVKQGADVIKVIANGGGTPGTHAWETTFSVDELKVISDEAHRKGVPVVAHVTCPDAIEGCIEANFDGLEHGTFWVDEDYNHEFRSDLAEKIAENEIVVDQTIQVSYGPLQNAETEEEIERKKKMVQDTFEAFSKFQDYGVKFVAGSDAGYTMTPFGEIRLGLRLMVENGMTEVEALNTATSFAAEVLQMEDQVGSLEKNKKADFIVTAGNPLDDITALEHLTAVYLGGDRVG